MNKVAILYINMIYTIVSVVGTLSGFALIGVGIGFGFPAVIIGGIVLVGIGAVSTMMSRMH
jgi:hypothetical protein